MNVIQFKIGVPAESDLCLFSSDWIARMQSLAPWMVRSEQENKHRSLSAGTSEFIRCLKGQ